jgi:hypothetical protein
MSHKCSLLIAASFSGVVLFSAAAVAAPAKWTILRSVCWQISATAGQCAVGLYGSFPSQGACFAANGGQDKKGRLGDGRVVHDRCEIAIE